MLITLLLLTVDPSSAPACPSVTMVLTKPSPCPLTDGQTVALRLSRIAVETVLGLVFAAPAEISGAYLGVLINTMAGQERGPGLSLGLAIGAAFATAPGVWLGGYAMGGDGSFGWTLLGSAVGTGFSAGLLAIRSNPATLAVAALFPVIGAIVGYELSSPHRRRVREASVQIVPTIGPTNIGLAGVF